MEPLLSHPPSSPVVSNSHIHICQPWSSSVRTHIFLSQLYADSYCNLCHRSWISWFQRCSPYKHVAVRCKQPLHGRLACMFLAIYDSVCQSLCPTHISYICACLYKISWPEELRRRRYWCCRARCPCCPNSNASSVCSSVSRPINAQNNLPFLHYVLH
jgi:hypothetical protein